MHFIKALNVNDALRQGLALIEFHGVERASRNGPVLAFPCPVMTEYASPRHRVLFSPLRDANPTFHLLEGLWMLAGRNDLKFPQTFVKRFSDFSDDGSTLHGAYGHRWRLHFGYDQLEVIAAELKMNPSSRRCVLQMWDPGSAAHATDTQSDLYAATHGGKDVPCNTSIYFDLRGGVLNMTVSNRSNDMIWGLYGANAVHMSMLQEYMAAKVGVKVGRMWTLSNDLHVYKDLALLKDNPLMYLARDAGDHDLYRRQPHIYDSPAPMLADGEFIHDFDDDLETFFMFFDSHGLEYAADQQYATQFFNFVVVPMVNAWHFHKVNRSAAQDYVRRIGSHDWQRAMSEWIGRRGVKA